MTEFDGGPGRPEEGAVSPRGSRAAAGALAALVLLGGAAGYLWWEEASRHESVVRAARRLDLAALRPNEAQAMRLEVGDPEIDPVAAGALEAKPTARPGLEELRGLLLRAIRRRPGRAYDVFLLARVERALTGAAGVGRWLPAMRLAARMAPGSDEIAETLAAALVDSWAILGPADRSGASEILRRALLAPDFVAAQFPRIRTILGQNQAIALLPSDSAALAAAERALEGAGEAGGAAAVAARATR